MNFGLMFFASDEHAVQGRERYRFVLESARFGDGHGFSSLWVPERHFTVLGSLFPNPAVLQAAVARETSRIRLCAGSVVLPIHDPLRVVEEWAMVDNLSGGRVAVSFASGWNPDDFAFFPDRYATRSDHLDEALPLVRALWRGERVNATSGTGRPVRLSTYPRPVQPELPVWLTAASNPATFAKAGALGANLLTHLLDQGVDALEEKIAVYRQARESAGLDPATGQVTVMIHTFVGEDAATAVAVARAPYCNYLKSNIGLLKGLAQSRGRDTDVTAMSERELDEFAEFIYERFAGERALIGSPATCLPLVRELARIGVDEVACLLDFGPPVDAALANLVHLDALRQLARGESEAEPAAAPVDRGQAVFDPRTLLRGPVREVTAEQFFTAVAGAGAEYGPAMRSLTQVWVGEGEVLGRLRVPAADPDADGWECSPAVMDNACLLLGALVGRDPEQHGLFLPVGVRSMRVHSAPRGTVYSHVVRGESDAAGTEVRGEVRVLDEQGRLLVEIDGLRMRAVAGGSAGARPEELHYRTDWVPTELPAAGPAGRWFVVGRSGDLGERLAKQIRSAGGEVERGSTVAELQALLADLPTTGALQGVVVLSPAEAEFGEEGSAEDLEAAQEHGIGAVLATARAVAERSSAGVVPRVWCVTRGAMVSGDTGARGLAQSTVWGFCRVFAAEHPDAWGGIVDLDPAGVDDDSTLAAILLRADDRREDQVVVRDGRLRVPRLVPAPELARAGRPVALDPNGTYLLAGGAGDLGVVMARRLVELGARSVVLTSRHGREDGATAALRRDAEHAGARVRVLAADVAGAAAVEQLPARIAEAGLPAVVGVIHLAAVARGATVAAMTPELLHEVLRPKVSGAWNLHRVFTDARLMLFVSAVPAVIGPVGVGAANYAAANAFLDALARYRRERGLSGSALGYGPWGELGMAVRENGLAQLERMGLGSMTTAEALLALDRCLELDPEQVTVARVDWPTLFTALPQARAIPQFAALLQAASPARSALGDELAGTEPERRPALVTSYLAERLSSIMGLPADGVELHRPLTEQGLDSLMSLDLRNRIEADLGVSVPTVRILEGPTPAELANTVLALVETAVLDEDMEEFSL